MILEGISSSRHNLFWTLAHIGLGYFCTISPFVLIGWFYLVLITNFFKSNSLLKNSKPAFFLMLFSYLISFEVLDRMSKTSPFIPYELSKYLLVFIGILGILGMGIRKAEGIIMFICIFIGLFYDLSGKREFEDAIYYALGPMAIALFLTFTNQLNIRINSFNNILKLIWFALVANLIFTYIKTPEYEDIHFSLRANFSTTAGFSSNQVATVFGLGFFLSYYSVKNKLYFSGYRVTDFFMMLLFLFQGLLSFSRGGIFVGFIGIIVDLYLGMPKHKVNKFKLLITTLIILVLTFLIFNYVNQITKGKLLLRYKGETEGTIDGDKKVDFNHFTTGRVSIFENDLKIWLDNLITGVGSGSSVYIRSRSNESKVLSHIELSRVLADHGLFGLIYIILLISNIRNALKREILNVQKTLIVIAFLTTFHAAMRTFVTPLFLLISLLNIRK